MAPLATIFENVDSEGGDWPLQRLRHAFGHDEDFAEFPVEQPFIDVKLTHGLENIAWARR
jgi:hypothetical protein